MRKKSISAIITTILLISLGLLSFLVYIKISNKSSENISSEIGKQLEELKKIKDNSNIIGKKIYVVSEYNNLNKKLAELFNELNIIYYIDNELNIEKSKDYDIIVILKTLKNIKDSKYYINTSVNDKRYYEFLSNIGLVNIHYPELNNRMKKINEFYFSKEGLVANCQNETPLMKLNGELKNLFLGIVFYNSDNNDKNLIEIKDSVSDIFSVDIKSSKIYLNGIDTNITINGNKWYGMSLEFADNIVKICLNRVCKELSITPSIFNEIVFCYGNPKIYISDILLDRNYYKNKLLRNEDIIHFDFNDKNKYSLNKLYDKNNIYYIENVSIGNSAKYYIPTLLFSLQNYYVKDDGNGYVSYISKIPIIFFNNTKKLFYFNTSSFNERNGYYITYNNTINNLLLIPTVVINFARYSSSSFYNKKFNEKNDVVLYNVKYNSFNFNIAKLRDEINSIDFIKKISNRKIFIFGDITLPIMKCSDYYITNKIQYKGRYYSSNVYRAYCLYDSNGEIVVKSKSLDIKNDKINYYPFIDDPFYIIKVILENY